MVGRTGYRSPSDQTQRRDVLERELASSSRRFFWSAIFIGTLAFSGLYYLNYRSSIQRFADLERTTPGVGLSSAQKTLNETWKILPPYWAAKRYLESNAKKQSHK